MSDHRTDDDIARLFATANPVPQRPGPDANGDEPGRPLRHRAERSDIMLHVDETRPDAPDRPWRTRGWLIGIAAAALVVVVGFAIARDGDDVPADDTDVTPPAITTPDTMDAPGSAVLDQVVDAFNGRDAAALRSTLAADADDAAVDVIEELIDEFEWYDAFGWRWTDLSCTDEGPERVVCDVTEQNRLTDYSGVLRFVSFDAHVVDGAIETLLMRYDTDQFSAFAFGPFIEFVAGTNPDDAVRMWSEGGAESSAARTELFDRYLTAFTAEPTPPMAPHRAVLSAHGTPRPERADIADLFAPGGSISDAWIDDPESYDGVLDVLAAWEFDWNLVSPSCDVDLDAEPVRITCRTQPTSVFAAAGLEILPRGVTFAVTGDGITSAAMGDLAGATARALRPFFDWIVDEHPDDVAQVLDVTGDAPSPVMTTDTAQRLGELAAEYVEAASTGDDG